MSTKPPHPRGALALPAFLLALTLLLLLRLPHLSGPLDDPHSWRQCDTASQTRAFVRDGVDLLHPSVRWLGGHRTLIFEFPLSEAIAAGLASVFGYDPATGHVWDRVVAFAFFLMSLAWFHACAKELTGSVTASRLASLAYAASPLAMFYSRAANVDFAAQAFVHALLWHTLRALRGGSALHAVVAAVLGALGALIKAPYLLPVALPVALVVLAALRPAAFLRAAIAFGVPAVAFALWRRHVDAVNSAVPDWTFLPGFYKEVNPLWWYVGDVAQRLQPAPWIKLAKRFVFEVGGPALALFAAAGAFAGLRAAPDRAPSPRVLALAWLAGAVAYLLVFFPLNVIHNYYQVPFVAPVALLAGLGGAWLFERTPSWLAAVVVAAALAVAAVMPDRLGWYRVDHVRVQAGEAIARMTAAKDLLVVVDRSSEFSDPRLLQRADREGWPLRAADATPAVLARLRAEGARWLVWVEEPGVAALEPRPNYEAAQVARRVTPGHAASRAGDENAPPVTVHVYSLDRLAESGVLP